MEEIRCVDIEIKKQTTIATTIEQSKHLLELGLKAETCDMHYEYTTEEPEFKLCVGGDIAINMNLFSYRNGHTIPAWSLGALLDLMPIIEHTYPFVARLTDLTENPNNIGKYYICWVGAKYFTEFYDTAMEAAYNMVVWLIENGYIKTGKL